MVRKATARKTAPKPGPKPAAKRAPKAAPAEHWIAVAGVALSVSYGKDRAEQFDLRGTATVNAGVADGILRTTGVAELIARRGKAANRVDHLPASLNRNLVFTLHLDPADLALLREVFVTGTTIGDADPALVVWVKTARPLATDAADSQPVTEFGYRLDFDPASIGPR
jgi:hypothetical protein